MRMQMVFATRTAFLAAALFLFFQSAHSSAEGLYKLNIGTHPSDPLWTAHAAVTSTLSIW